MPSSSPSRNILTKKSSSRSKRIGKPHVSKMFRNSDPSHFQVMTPKNHKKYFSWPKKKSNNLISWQMVRKMSHKKQQKMKTIKKQGKKNQPLLQYYQSTNKIMIRQMKMVANTQILRHPWKKKTMIKAQ